MSRSFAAILALSLSLSTSALAQEPTATDADVVVTPVAGSQGVVSFAPLSLIFGVIGVEYERPLNTKMSFYVAPNLTLPFGLGGLLSGSAGVSYFGVGTGVGLRFFLTKDAPQGLFVGPELNVNYVTVSASGGGSSATASGLGYGASGMVGYSFITEGGFAISTGLGVGVSGSAVRATSSGGQTSSAASSSLLVLPTFRFNVGYGF